MSKITLTPSKNGKLVLLDIMPGTIVLGVTNPKEFEPNYFLLRNMTNPGGETILKRPMSLTLPT